MPAGARDKDLRIPVGFDGVVVALSSAAVAFLRFQRRLQMLRLTYLLIYCRRAGKRAGQIPSGRHRAGLDLHRVGRLLDGATVLMKIMMMMMELLLLMLLRAFADVH